MAGGSGIESWQESPTWAMAAVCAVFIVISVLIEQCIHFLEMWFKKRQKKAMSEALEKIKAELMLLGFISLLLTVSPGVVSRICIPPKYGKSMLPCKPAYEEEEDHNDEGGDHDDSHDKRKLLSFAGEMVWRRVLAASGADDEYCSKHGKMALISQSGLHQLHIFIFILAVFHVLYSVITMALAGAKMKKWKAWEAETSSLEYKFSHDPQRFRFTNQTSFVRRHSRFHKVFGVKWIVAFFRQFSGSVTKVDYLTMRQGFINAHLAPDSEFDFRKYIKKSMQDDFKAVVGISFPLWIFAILFLLLNVYKWYALAWISMTPFLIILLVGTKLEVIIMDMAQDIQDRASVVRGAPLVEPNDKFFWFSRPHWILLLIHFTLFQNAFQMAYFLWTWREFGWRSCFHENVGAILSRVVVGLALQILCSYITFPLYALVTQMGSHMKKAIFEKEMAEAIRDWHREAKQRNKMKSNAGPGGGRDYSSNNSPPSNSSPLHLLHNRQQQPGHDFETIPTSPAIPHPYSPADKTTQQPSKPQEIIDGSSMTNDGVDESTRHESRRASDAADDSRSIEFSFVRP